MKVRPMRRREWQLKEAARKESSSSSSVSSTSLAAQTSIAYIKLSRSSSLFLFLLLLFFYSLTLINLITFAHYHHHQHSNISSSKTIQLAGEEANLPLDSQQSVVNHHQFISMPLNKRTKRQATHSIDRRKRSLLFNMFAPSSSSTSSAAPMPAASKLQQQHVAAAATLPPPLVSASASTVVAIEPEFVEPIGNHTVALGKEAQLSCKINNLGQFRTAWLRVEDKGILTIHKNIITRNYRISLLPTSDEENNKEFVLVIKNVQPSDKGGYMCQINSVPMKYNIGYLDVLTPPVFEDTTTITTATSSGSTTLGASATALAQHTTSQLQEAVGTTTSSSSVITVVEGGNVTLTCKASGNPQPNIVWRREDNEPILLEGLLQNGASIVAASSSGNFGLEGGVAKIDTPSFTLTNVNRLNSGAYLCIASNGVQPAASKRQLLHVQFSPVIHLPQTEQSAYLNEPEVRLRCFVELNPLGDYHWVKLGGGGGATTTTSTMTSDSDNSRQDGGGTLSAGVALNSDDLALIESRNELVNSDKYEIVIKPTTSIPTTTTTTFNNQQQQQQQQPTNTVERIEMLLIIKHINKQDFGRYKCIARNSLGVQSNSVRLYEESRSGSSSFSLNNMFRGGGGGGGGAFTAGDGLAPATGASGDQQYETATGRGNKPQQISQGQSRTHTRSSWIQRNRAATSTNGESSLAASNGLFDTSGLSFGSQSSSSASPSARFTSGKGAKQHSLMLISLLVLTLFNTASTHSLFLRLISLYSC